MLLLLAISGGCTNMIAGRFADNLGAAILAQDDPETVRQGVPAYLIMLDSLVLQSPNDAALLQTSASLHSAYAGLFAQNPLQAKRLSSKARQQSRKALCERQPAICDHDDGALGEFQTSLAKVNAKDIAYLYTYGSAWATWIQANKGDWNAVADLPRVEAIMMRIVAIDESYEWGRAHLYLGVINSQLPATLGGQPEKGRVHFEKAIALSGGQDLIAKVELARNYARLVFDKTLHDQLLNEVLTTPTTISALTLSNTLAREAASELLATSAEYFEE
ncbi:MAG: TRAP transporter TatT component family protein [Pseudomonadota bacterium]|nr:TRAP transporter TatT component family protein [Pseudomonadota bacterium]